MSVRLTHYDPRWRQEFQQTRSGLLHACLGWVTAVEHIGSTAISGLIARPTIDVLAGVDQLDALGPAADQLEGLNYARVASPTWVGDSITLHKPRRLRRDETEPTHVVFLMIKASSAWSQAVRVRDHLQFHPEVAIRFEEAKVARWRSGVGDPESYQVVKEMFFAHLIEQIDADSR